MVLLRHIHKLCHWLHSSPPSDILLFLCNCILVFGHVVSMRLFYYALDDFLYTVHATVADFNCIAVENFVKLVVSWKMFCYQLKEYLCNVCWNGFAKGCGLNHFVLLSHFLFFWFFVGVFQIKIITWLLTNRRSSTYTYHASMFTFIVFVCFFFFLIAIHCAYTSILIIPQHVLIKGEYLRCV